MQVTHVELAMMNEELNVLQASSSQPWLPPLVRCACVHHTVQLIYAMLSRSCCFLLLAKKEKS